MMSFSCRQVVMLLRQRKDKMDLNGDGWLEIITAHHHYDD